MTASNRAGMVYVLPGCEVELARAGGAARPRATRPSPCSSSRAARPCCAARARSSASRRGRRLERRAATRRSSPTTRTRSRGAGPRCTTRTPASCSSRQRLASSSPTSPAATTWAAAATVRSRRATRSCPCSRSGSTRRSRASSTCARRRSRTSASRRPRTRPCSLKSAGGGWSTGSCAGGTSRTSACSAAMERVPRELFLPEGLRDRAYDDAALPIGGGQTMSQPYMVAKMCELLSLDGDERVLDVGTGSGYHAAVLAELADEVVTIERVPELAERARASLEAAGLRRASRCVVGDGTLGRARPRALRRDRRRGRRAGPARIALRAARGRRPPRRAGRRPLEPAPRADRPQPGGPAVVRSVPCRFVPLLGEEGFSE